MIDVESCRHYAADCVHQASGEQSAEDKNILLNVALAWLRLAQQTQAMAEPAQPADDAPAEFEHVGLDHAALEHAGLEHAGLQPAEIAHADIESVAESHDEAVTQR
jgi:hypothetical protein